MKPTADPHQFLDLARDLCKFATGVVADENDALFKRLDQELALELFYYSSKEVFNGWEVPLNWRVNKAELSRDGVVVFDGKSHTLGVGRYSRSFAGELDWEHLKPHLVTNPDLPDAMMFHCMWQYRPWQADWALCIPHNIYRTLGPGKYRVDLKTEYSPGSMLVGHHIKQGKSNKTIIFQSNTCHPHMANDGFAGTAVLIRLFQWLAKIDTYYSYRLILGPEHLGTVFYLRDQPQETIGDFVSGIFEEMPGTSAPIKATSTFLGNQMIDQAIHNALRHQTSAYELVPWRMGAGNDEVVWEAPGYEVPFVEVTRSENIEKPFKEYHSSLDTVELMDPVKLTEMHEVLKNVIRILEHNAVINRKFNGLICLSHPQYNLYKERPDPTVVKDISSESKKWGYLQDCLSRYFDGETTILDIAQKHDLPFGELRDYLEQFEEKNLVKLEFREIVRSPVTKV